MFSPLEIKALLLLTKGQVRAHHISDPLIQALVNSEQIITPTIKSWEDIGMLLVEGLILGAHMRLSTISNILSGVHHTNGQTPNLRGLANVD